MKEIEKTKIWSKPVVTQLAPLEKFYRAEAYHQNYFKNNPVQGYCQIVIEPKVANFRKQDFDRLKRISRSL